jgi:Ni,Fe-hydrogenase III large subunit
MHRKFIEHRAEARQDKTVQLSTIFEVDGKGVSIFSDIENEKTVISDLPIELGENLGPLIRGLEAPPGKMIDLEQGSRIEGYGVFTFPYGPVTSGISEAGGFKIVTYGERILKVIPLVNFKKRGVENAVVQKGPEEALLLVERSAGNFSASYSSCFVTSVEEALGVNATRQAKWTRAVAIELERIYNHLHVFSREAEAASQNVATYQTSALKERILRINSKYFNHRFLFGFNRIGGVNIDFSDQDKRRQLFNEVREVASEFSELIEYFLSSRIFLDRLQNTSKLSKDDALLLGTVGPAARGSNIDWDDRVSYPIEPYDEVFVDISTETTGDAMARVMVRIKEITASVTVLQQLLDKMPIDGTIEKPSGKNHAAGSEFSFCRIESPSGDLILAIKIGSDCRIKKLHIRPPSLANMQAFARSLEGNVFTDFQFSFESFGFNYADCDR